MSGAKTSGFDIVVELTEKAINDGLKMLPGPSGTPPGKFPLTEVQQIFLQLVQLANVQVPYDVQLELDRPSVTLDPTTGHVTVTCKLGPSSELTLAQASPPGTGTLALFSQIPLNGTVQFDCPLPPSGVGFATTPWPNGPVSGQAVLALLTDPSVKPVFNVPQLTVGTVILNNQPVTVLASALQTALAGVFTDFPTSIGDLPLTTPIPLNAGPNPVESLQDVEAKILGPGPNPAALGIGLLSGASPSGSGNISGITQDPALAVGLVTIANLWLIRLVCQTIQLSPGFQGVHFTIGTNPPSGTFHGPIQINPPTGDAFTLNNMSVTINPSGGIDISGDGSISGFCYSATFTFMGTLVFSCNSLNGVVASLSSPLNVSASASIPWYCWLVAAVVLGIITGGLTTWLVGLIVAIVVAIVLASINPGLPNLSSISGIAGLFTGPGLPLPFPVGSPGLIVSACQFDDLGVQGTPLYIDLAPRQSSGDDLVLVNTGFDLDTAVISPMTGAIPGNIDLLWTGNSIDSENGCRLAIVNTSFESLTLTDLEQMSYGLNTIPSAQIPLFVLPWWWFPGLPLSPIFLGPPLVFGAKTIEGLYAKCAAWREQGGSRLYLQFETYAGTTVNFSIDTFIETTDLKILDQDEESCWHTVVEPVPASSHQCPGIEVIQTKDRVFLIQVKRAQRIKVHALPQLLTAPISYQWTVLGVALGTGQGTVNVQNTTVQYDAASPYLTLTAPMGVDVVGQICVLATDADGRQCQACVTVNRPGTITLGGCNTCPQPTSLQEYRREIARLNRVAQGGSAAERRLRVLTAQVQVPQSPPVPVSEALEALISR